MSRRSGHRFAVRTCDQENETWLFENRIRMMRDDTHLLRQQAPAAANDIGLRRCRRDSAYDRGQRERFALGFPGGDGVENVGGMIAHDQILAKYGSSAARLSRLCAGANRST